MPRLFTDRDSFVRRIERRREAARWVANARRKVGLAHGPTQAAIYDGTFRSDEEAVSYFYALRNDHLPDFENPTWVNEKVRWQFINRPNPLMGLAADKIAVNSYLNYKGARFMPPETVAAGSQPEELLSASLPKKFALKSTASSGQNYFEDGTRGTPRTELAAQLARWNQLDYWRHAGEMHYRGLRKRWIAEELVGTPEQIVEYKFYCLHGEPMFILAISGRSGTNYNCALFDLDWKLTDFHWRGYAATAASTERPAKLATLIEEARRLSEDFIHVRVDFMQCGDRIMFSELTFSGGAARNPFMPLVKNVEFGDRIDLGRSSEYIERGERIASELDWHSGEPVRLAPAREPRFVARAGLSSQGA